MKSEQLTFKLDPAVKHKLMLEAGKQRRSLSGLMHIIVEDYLKKKK